MAMNGQAFFKVFIAHTSKEKLQLPLGYTRALGRAIPDELVLRDGLPCLYLIKVEQVGDVWYFGGVGWGKFVECNRLEDGDIMFFDCFCDNLYDVKVLGASRTEKIGVGPSKVTLEQKVSEDRSNEEEEESSCYVIERPVDVPKGPQEDEHLETAQEQGSISNLFKPSRILTAKYSGKEIFESGLARKPQNLYFVTKVLPKRRSALFVPKCVVSSLNVDLTEHELMLVDQRGRKFRAMAHEWKGGRLVISGKWRSLCKMNFVTDDDNCICEFVRREGRCIFIHVHIVHASGP